MKFLLLILMTLSLAHASTESDAAHAPKSFSYLDGRAVFVDFTEAYYTLTYDIKNKQASVKALIKLNVIEDGYPIFDLIPDTTLVKIDGIEAKAATVSTPSNETKVRVLDRKLPIGSYELEIHAPLKTLVDFTSTGVKNAFWVTDLEDRFYLERYIPTNLEYDRYKMTFEVNFLGLQGTQHIFANGKVTWTGTEKALIEFPEHFTVNSLYYHTTPVGSVKLINFDFASVSGRTIPVTIYSAGGMGSSASLERFQALTNKVIKELEADYIPFPHDSVTIYDASLAHMGLGGMEYAGATVTDISSAGHELFHSYFARGVSPANGNAGWIDESLASWRDNGYQRNTTLNGSSSMAYHAPYTRKTDTQAYGFGAKFMAFLDNRFAAKGGLKPFMNKLLETKLFTPIFTEEFIAEMEKFYGESVTEIFKDKVYRPANKELDNHPIHKKMALEDMYKLL
jgi:hypothetical protein